MRISDWSSDVCSSDLAYTGFATDTTTQQKEGQLPVDPPQRVPQRGCEPRLGVPASRGPDRNRTWRGAATPRRDSMTVLDRKWPQKIGRAHIWTPATNAHLVCSPFRDKKTTTNK